MIEFVYQSLPSRVVFAADALARLPDEVARLGIRRALLLSTPGHRHLAEAAARLLGRLAIGIYDQAVMHVPIETAEAGRAEARRLGADGCIAIGGGSTIGLGKAIVLELDLPLVAVPTTYSGSEMMPIQGMTAGGIKRTQRDPKMLPKTVIYDPKLTLTLPPSISGTSGMNAVAHCVEALYARNANPMTSLMAEEGIRALARSLPVVVREPASLAARTEALYGAWLAGAALGAVGMALHHKLCHVLGGVSTCRMPRSTRSSYPMPPATIATLRPMQWHGLRALWARRSRPQGYSISQRLWAPRCGSQTSACEPRIWTGRPISPCAMPTTTQRR